jgi:protein-S-isoprenylcysteine O-methyltransferase Ste14
MLANLLTYLNVSPATPPEPGITTMYFNAEDSIFSVVVVVVVVVVLVVVVVVPSPLLASFTLFVLPSLLLLLLLALLLLLLSLSKLLFEPSLLFSKTAAAEVREGSGAYVTISCIAFSTT